MGGVLLQPPLSMLMLVLLLLPGTSGERSGPERPGWLRAVAIGRRVGRLCEAAAQGSVSCTALATGALEV